MIQKGFTKFSFGYICLLLVAFLPSCGGANIDKDIRNAVGDVIITSSEWTSIVALAEKNPDYKDENGQFDAQLLKNCIQDFASNKMRGIDEVIFDEDIESIILASSQGVNDLQIKFKFYLERSGSMVPYDSPSTKGEFKKAITQLLNSIPNNANVREDDNLLYIVNDAVYSYNKSYKDFLTSKDIFSDTKQLGDPRYTDFTCIFDSILTHTAPNELSILASDLIYSTKEMATTNPQKILNEAEALTTSIFKGHNGLDVTVIKLTADYDGNYYPYNSPSKGIKYKGQRPYYLMLVATPEVMNKIMTDPQYEDFRDFEDLKGFVDYYCFSSNHRNPLYSVLLSDHQNIGRFKATRGQGEIIHNLEEFDADKDGVRSFAVAVDLHDVITPDDYKTNKDNYTISSNSGFIIEEIEEIDKEDMSTEAKRAVPNATHKFIITSRYKIKNHDKINITLNKVLPQWIEGSSTNDDSDIKADRFDETTFAFKELMQGIYESFISSNKQKTEFEISFEIAK